MCSPLVSIVVPVYNMGDSLEKCVNSLLSQTYQNIEIVLVDDGSTDDSYKRCLSLASLDGRVKVIHTNNQGSGPARNTGTQESSGEYIYYPDADDYLVPGAIERLVCMMNDSGADLIVFGFKTVDRNHREVVTTTYPNLVLDGDAVRNAYQNHLQMRSELGIQGAPWNKFFRAEIVHKEDVVFPALRRHQDEAFIARYVSHVDRVQFIEDVLYEYMENTLESTWKKYPLNYIDAVIGLYEERKRNVLIWNVNNIILKELVEKEYVCGVIRSLEITFSPKCHADKHKRLEMQREIIEKSGLASFRVTDSLKRMKYQAAVMARVNKMDYRALYRLLRLKVFIEGRFSRPFNTIKRVVR